MSKFYVQCANLELILQSETVENAALSALDRVLSPHIWIYDDPGLSESECLRHLMVEALLHLPTNIKVSQKGFGSEDGVAVPVPELIQMWHRLMVGVQRLFHAAGINKTISVLASQAATQRALFQTDSDTPPRIPR